MNNSKIIELGRKHGCLTAGLLGIRHMFSNEQLIAFATELMKSDVEFTAHQHKEGDTPS